MHEEAAAYNSIIMHSHAQAAQEAAAGYSSCTACTRGLLVHEEAVTARGGRHVAPGPGCSGLKLMHRRGAGLSYWL